MEALDVLLIVAVPVVAVAGLVVAGYLLFTIGRGLSSLLPAPWDGDARQDALGAGIDLRAQNEQSDPWIRPLEQRGPFPETTSLTEADRRGPAPPAHRTGVIAQILFTHLRHDGIFVDTVVLEALGDAEGLIGLGAPLSLRVERPGPEVLGACSEALLELWAERGEVVRMDLVVQGEDVRAEITNGSSRVVLDIAEAAGLP